MPVFLHWVGIWKTLLKKVGRRFWVVIEKTLPKTDWDLKNLLTFLKMEDPVGWDLKLI